MQDQSMATEGAATAAADQVDADVITCAWYHAGIRDFHLAWMRANPRPGMISIVRITDDRLVDKLVEENKRFGAEKVYVFRSQGKVLRNLVKLLPIFSLYAFWITWREGRRRQFITHDGFCFWMIPSFILRRRCYLFAHDPKPHESAEQAMAATIRKRYFRWVYFRKHWRAIVVGSESNRAKMLEGNAVSDTIVSPFPKFDADLFEGGAGIPELGGETGYILFFGRVDIYKGVYDWLVANADGLVKSHRVVIAGEMIDKRVLDFADRVTIIGRFIKTEEVPGLFENARALICPYISSTHSGIVDMGVSFGTPVYVSRIPYFEEMYADRPEVRYLDALAPDLAADSA
ncbi:MAG: hypothetical protein CML46_21005 [Rhodobacteraceae bacterium]|nr:hypothetical protein [Paracoccaceae bacterium]MBR29391.1 hypothetical protein [Paracoccaceae bacterium]